MTYSQHDSIRVRGADQDLDPVACAHTTCGRHHMTSQVRRFNATVKRALLVPVAVSILCLSAILPVGSPIARVVGAADAHAARSGAQSCAVFGPAIIAGVTIPTGTYCVTVAGTRTFVAT